jgi:hypothetical protein
VDRGELDYRYIAELDPFLESLRGTERFARLMLRLEAKWREMAAPTTGVS